MLRHYRQVDQERLKNASNRGREAIIVKLKLQGRLQVSSHGGGGCSVLPIPPKTHCLRKIIKWGFMPTDPPSETVAVTQLPFTHLVEINDRTQKTAQMRIHQMHP